MIPWDDDADITIIMKDNEDPIQIKQKVLDCLKVLNKNNINSYEHKVGNIVIAHFNNTPSCIDIFFLKKGGFAPEDSSLFEGDIIYRYLAPFDTKYPNEYYFYNEIFPIKEYTFGPIILKGPNNPYDFLERTYPNWRETASKWNHFRQVPKSSSQFVFQPVLPDPDHEDFPWVKKECDVGLARPSDA
jgi:phosphorylcholine metabolism protein LicD